MRDVAYKFGTVPSNSGRLTPMHYSVSISDRKQVMYASAGSIF